MFDHMLCRESLLPDECELPHFKRNNNEKLGRGGGQTRTTLPGKRVMKPVRQIGPAEAQADALTLGPFTCFSLEQPLLWLGTYTDTFLSLSILLEPTTGLPRYSTCHQRTLRINSIVSILILHYFFILSFIFNYSIGIYWSNAKHTKYTKYILVIF